MIASARLTSLNGCFYCSQIIQCTVPFSKIANSAAQTERELGAACKPLPESFRDDLPLQYYSICGVGKIDPVTSDEASPAGITVTRASMLQSSSQSDAHRVESI